MRTPLILAIVFYITMVCLLIPLGFFSRWCVHNARPRATFSWLAEVEARQMAFGMRVDSAHLNQFYCTDLESGSTSTRNCEPMLRFLAVNQSVTKAWVLGEKSRDKFVFQRIDLTSDQPPEVREIPEMDSINRQELAGRVGMVDDAIIRLRLDTLESIDFQSGKIVDSIVLPNKNLSRIDFIGGTKRILVEGVPAPVSNLRDVFLLELSDGRFRQIANWSDLSQLNLRVGNENYVVSLLANGATIEVRNSSDGEMVAKYPIPQDPSLPTVMTQLEVSSYGKSWLQFISNPTLHFDVLTGRILPVPVGSDLIERDLVNNHLIVMDKKADGNGWECALLDEANGQELSRFEVPSEHYRTGIAYGRAFVDSANRLVLTTRDYRIFIYDLAQGKLVRSIDPFLWSDWCRRFIVAWFSVWCVVWLCVSAKVHPHGWLDLAVCTGLVLSLYSDLQIGVFSAWVLVATWWLLFGKTRWSLRFQPLLLLVGVTLGITYCSSSELNASSLFIYVIGLSLLMLIYVLTLMPLKWLRFRIQREDISNPVSHETTKCQPQSVSLRDMFSLTIVFAFLFAVFRWLPVFRWVTLSPPEWTMICAVVIWNAGSSLFAMWVALSGRSGKLRWGIVLVAWIALVFLGTRLLGGILTPEFVLTPFFSTLIGFYAYRLRGWRLSRRSDASRTLPV